MKNMIKACLIIAAGLLVVPAHADSRDIKAAKETIKSIFKNVDEKNISPSPITGLYEVIIPPRLYYVSADGKYLFNGDLIDIRRNQNISKIKRSKAVLDSVNALGEDAMIIFGKPDLKHTVTVFTDIDCAYCRKLHSQIDEYNKRGIRIRYIAYPRAGVGSASFKKAEAVWCSKDRKAALTKAKNDLPVKSKKCDNPVAAEFALGNKIGIRGTPALVLEDGSIVPGYIPPARLAEGLDGAK